MTKLAWVFILLLLASCATKRDLQGDDEKLIEYLFSSYDLEGPGASVMVIKKGDIVHSKSYGLANVEQKSTITPSTNFRIASVSKQFTCMAIMILVDQNKLSYNSTLKDVFEKFPSHGSDITIRHLMTHRSGLIDYDEFIDDSRVEQILDAEVLDSVMTIDSTYFAAGTQFKYSNTAYAVLAQVIEKVSGLSFNEFVNKEIFQKIGMQSSMVYLKEKEIPNRAYGYKRDDASVTFSDQSVTSAIKGDGCVYTSMLDYYKWDQALYGNALLPKEKLDDAFHNWENGTKTNGEGYGYGWYIEFLNGIKVLQHSGGTSGFAARVMRVPSLELSIVIFVNHEDWGTYLYNRANALLSIYSDYEIQMPLQILIKKEIEQKDINSGIEIYDKLKNDKRYKLDKTTLIYLGMEYLRGDELDKAEGLFVKSQLIYPDYFGHYFGLGRLYKKKGHNERAILNFEKVLELGVGDEGDWMIGYVEKQLESLR